MMTIRFATVIAAAVLMASVCGCVEQMAPAAMPAPLAPRPAATADETSRKLEELARRMSFGDPGSRQNVCNDYDRYIAEIARPGNEAQRPTAAAQISLLAATPYPPETSAYLVRSLGELGGGAASKFVDDEDSLIRDAALAALARDPSAKAQEILLARLQKSSGKDAILFTKALGYRAKPAPLTIITEPDFAAEKFEDALAAQLGGDATEAACNALGKIGSRRTIAALHAYLGKTTKETPAPFIAAADDALLASADRIIAWINRPIPVSTTNTYEGATSGHLLIFPMGVPDALAIYTALDIDASPAPVHVAAFRGQLLAMTARGAPANDKLPDQVWNAFAGNDSVRRGVVISVLTSRRGDEAVQKLLAPLRERFSGLSTEGKAATIRLAATLGWREFAPRVITSLGSKEQSVRAAALEAAGTLCNNEAVQPLLDLMVLDESSVNAGRQSLARLRDLPTNEPAHSIQKTLESLAGNCPAPKMRAEAIRALGARRTSVSVVLTAAAKDSDESVRAVALEVVGQLGTAAEAGTAIDLLAAAKSSAEREAAESAVRAIFTRIDDVNKRAEFLAAGMAKATGDNHLAIIRLLGRTGAESALKSIRGYLKDSDDATKDAATRALTDWPNPDVMSDLIEIAKSDPDEGHRVLAVRGYARLVAAKLDRPAVETAKLCATMLPLARPEEKRLFISSLGWADCAESFALVAPLVDENGTAREAMMVASKIGRSAIKTDADLVIATMQKIITKTQPTEEMHKNAEQVLAAAMRAKGP